MVHALAWAARAAAGDTAQAVRDSEPPAVVVADVAGTAVRLAADPTVRAWVVVFMGTECPIARGYVPELNRIAAAARDDAGSVRFYGVISDPTVDRAAARAFVEEFAVTFPVLHDADGALARRLAPTHVPEAFVFDAGFRLVYRGRIDDTYQAVGRRRPQATRHDLRDALDAVRAGRRVEMPYAAPVGCPFENRRP